MINARRKVPGEVAGQAARRQLLLASAALLGAGTLLGVSTNLAKVAHRVGLAPLPFLTWSFAGAACLLLIVSIFRHQLPRLDRRSVEYFIVAACLSGAGSNLLFFHAVTHVGVSFVALALSLPPLLTWFGSLVLRMESFCWWRASAVVMALLGTGILVLGNWKAPGASHLWIAVTLIGPGLLAAGNIYRTLRWPPGASAESLAPGMLLAATVVLLLAGLTSRGPTLDVTGVSPYALPLIGVQALIFAGLSLLMFVLQKLGGPVFLSLMGAVGAIVGVPVARVILAEPALPALIPAAALIAAGIVSMAIGVGKCGPVGKKS